MKVTILGIPKPKQSARFYAKKGKGGKTMIKSYQKQEVKDAEKNMAFSVISQLPKGFVPYDEPIAVDILFVFPPLSSFSKKKKSEIEFGAIYYKDTKPDLTDNLNKGVFDALEGIVFVNDSRICKISSKKIYGLVPRTELTFSTLNQQ